MLTLVLNTIYLILRVLGRETRDALAGAYNATSRMFGPISLKYWGVGGTYTFIAQRLR